MDSLRLRAAIEAANVPALVLTTATLTGDVGLLRPDWAPSVSMLGDSYASADPDEIRRICADRLADWISAGAGVPSPTRELMDAAWEWLGLESTADRATMIAEEVTLLDQDVRRPDWAYRGQPEFAGNGVAIIGAGVSGLATAHRLLQAGIPFTIFESADEVGGVWRANSYPGSRVDIPSQLYSFSFAKRAGWANKFSTQPVILDYLRDVAGESIRERIRFSAEVTALRWDEETSHWHVTYQTAQGSRTEPYRFVVSAVGTQSLPYTPHIEGAETFRGHAFHSADWPHAGDLSGKRIGVIGTGASAFQFVPEIAGIARHVEVFQRTAAWMLPTPDYYEEFDERVHMLYEQLPYYASWERAWTLHLRPLGLRILDACRVDPEYPPTERAVSALNERYRDQLYEALVRQVSDPELLLALTPDHPIGAKRMIHDNGRWIAALQSDAADLITVPIERIEPDGIRTADGVLHECDVIIYSTGFRATDFLEPIEVIGRDGVELHDFWDRDARAHLGMMVPGYPNLAFLYGPNTEPVVHGASIPYLVECQLRLVLDLMRQMIEKGASAVDVRRDVFEQYCRDIDAENARMVWAYSHVNSWYKNAKGGISQALPYSIEWFWKSTRAAPEENYDWTATGA